MIYEREKSLFWCHDIGLHRRKEVSFYFLKFEGLRLSVHVGYNTISQTFRVAIQRWTDRYTLWIVLDFSLLDRAITVARSSRAADQLPDPKLYEWWVSNLLQQFQAHTAEGPTSWDLAESQPCKTLFQDLLLATVGGNVTWF